MALDLSFGGFDMLLLLCFLDTLTEERHLLNVFLNSSKNILVFVCLSFSLSLVISRSYFRLAPPSQNCSPLPYSPSALRGIDSHWAGTSS